MERYYDLVIIGAGPAGMSAAIYGSRAGLSTLILEMGAPGGKLIKTNEISNWPGSAQHRARPWPARCFLTRQALARYMNMARSSASRTAR